MTADRWFEVDRAGFAANLTDEDRSRSVLELVQNGWDADGATRVAVTLTPMEERARWRVVVEDDAPDGFADLTHAWTLYAPSTKRADATKRGRFNEGEKRILSLCVQAAVASTRGAVSFNADGTRVLHPNQRRAAGSRFDGIVRLTKPQGEAALRLLFQLIGPAGVTTTINGETLPARSPVRSFDVSLPTVVTRLGHAWFDRPNPLAVDELLIHEFAHEMAANHYSEEFHGATCRLGAQMRYVTARLGDDTEGAATR